MWESRQNGFFLRKKEGQRDSFLFQRYFEKALSAVSEQPMNKFVSIYQRKNKDAERVTAVATLWSEKKKY